MTAILGIVAPAQLEGAHVWGIGDVANAAMPLAHSFVGRLSLAFSRIDMLGGRVIERVASAECDRVATAAKLDKVLAIGTRFGELAAAREELAYLEPHVGDLDAFIADTASRCEHQRTPAIELDELRERRTEMQLHIEKRREALTMLEEIDGAESVVDLDNAVGAYQVGYAFGGICQGDTDGVARSARADRDRIDHLGETSDALHQLHARHSIQLIELEGRGTAVATLVAARKPLPGGLP